MQRNNILSLLLPLPSSHDHRGRTTTTTSCRRSRRSRSRSGCRDAAARKTKHARASKQAHVTPAAATATAGLAANGSDRTTTTLATTTLATTLVCQPALARCRPRQKTRHARLSSSPQRRAAPSGQGRVGVEVGV